MRQLPTRSKIAALLSSSDMETIVLYGLRRACCPVVGDRSTLELPRERPHEDVVLCFVARDVACRRGCHGAAELGLSAGGCDRRAAAAGNRRTQARAGEHTDLHPIADRCLQ